MASRGQGALRSRAPGSAADARSHLSRLADRFATSVSPQRILGVLCLLKPTAARRALRPHVWRLGSPRRPTYRRPRSGPSSVATNTPRSAIVASGPSTARARFRSPRRGVANEDECSPIAPVGRGIRHHAGSGGALGEEPALRLRQQQLPRSTATASGGSVQTRRTGVPQTVGASVICVTKGREARRAPDHPLRRRLPLSGQGTFR